MLRVIKPEPR